MCMFSLLYKEVPAIEHSQNKAHIQHREDVQVLGGMFVDTGSRGLLVNSYIDPLILAAMSFEESRYRQHGPDGDPALGGIVPPTLIRNTKGKVVGVIHKKRTKPKGQSIGPMQISRSAPYWVKIWTENDPDIGIPWMGLTVTKLREPAVNIAFAYSLLEKYKRDCGESPAVWIDSYGRGKCSYISKGKRRVGKKAKKRCKHIDAFVKKLSKQSEEFEAPKNWSCLDWVPEKVK